MGRERYEPAVYQVIPGALQEESQVTSSASGMEVGAESTSSWDQTLALGQTLLPL